MKNREKYMNIGFVGPYGSANLGDYGILINDIFDIDCNHITVFSYNFLWPKVQLEEYCKDYVVDYCHVKLKENLFSDVRITDLNEFELLDGCANVDEVMHYMQSVDTLVVSGGGWINDFWAERTEKIGKIAIVIYIAKRLNKNIRFATQGLGPLGEFSEWYSSLFKGINTVISVRDASSLIVGKEELNIQTKLYPDDFLIQNKKWNSFESSVTLPKDPYIVIEPFVPIEELRENVSRIKGFLRHVHDKYNCNVFFMPFDLVHFGNDQARFCAGLADTASYYDISDILFPKYEDVIRIMECAKLVISARYHGLVLALSHRVPVIHVVNNSHGDYGRIKAYSVLEWCFSKTWNSGTFCVDSIFEAFEKVEHDFYDVLLEQNSMFENYCYDVSMKKANDERRLFIKSLME